MKVIILAGGLGTRISEYTKTIPKPMIRIKNKPILHHIMDHYSSYGHKEFFIALGYKGNVIKNYFKNKKLSSWKINLIETGKNTMTGGRLKKFENIIKDETFMITYGDGLSDININKLINFHKKNKKIATLTAVRPPARFGSVKLHGNKVIYFKEKSKLDEGWINGGFFVMERKIFKYIKDNKTFLEKEPLVTISKKKELVAFKHLGFWQCMDTKRDKDYLEKNFKIKKN
jgi:glucose-1-phosphate cytidylyltransferase